MKEAIVLIRLSVLMDYFEFILIYDEINNEKN